MSTTLRSYKLKIYANKNKLAKLDALITWWQQEVNRKINIYWQLPKVSGSQPPKETTRGGRLVKDASNKAWGIVKGARKQSNPQLPIYKGSEIDLNEHSVIFQGWTTKSFDMWVKVSHLEKRHRLVLPCKKIVKLNKAISKGGKLRKSAKILKVKGKYYLQVYVNLPGRESKSTNSKLGIDVGLTNAVATSDGEFYGKDLRDLRIRTKHRKYLKKTSPFKQGLNGVANELIKDYKNTDFVMEDLLFKGKKGRSRKFRRNNKNWAYKHLANRLEQHGELEGFKVIKVEPAYTSQTCPKCKYVDKENRSGDRFTCKKCGYSNHADIVGAINILERVSKECSVPLSYTKRKEGYQYG
jgi:IS605 OrfB family transposase